MSSKPVSIALYGRLAGDATLTALLATTTSIYSGRATQGSSYPYIVFGRASQVRVARSFGTPGVDNDIWRVSAFVAGSDAQPAENIDSRVAELLDDYELTVTGHHNLWLARESGFRLVEDTDTGTVWQVGGEYRLTTEPA